MERQKQSIYEFMDSRESFLKGNFLWMVDGENTPSLEDRKILLQKLGDGMVELEDAVNAKRRSIEGSAFFSQGLDLADYIRGELNTPIREFANGDISRDPEMAEYEIKDSIRPRLNQMAEEFHEYQNYVRLMELQIRYTRLYRRLSQWLGGNALREVENNHMKVMAVIPA